jgi:hypothetical protein
MMGSPRRIVHNVKEEHGSLEKEERRKKSLWKGWCEGGEGKLVMILIQVTGREEVGDGRYINLEGSWRGSLDQSLL